VASHAREWDDTLKLDWQHLSAVKIDYFPHEPALHNVTNNQLAIVRTAVRNALLQGYRRIGFVMHRGWDFSVDRMWSSGYLCERQDIPEEDHLPAFLFPEPEPVEEWINERESVVPTVASFSRWLQLHKPEVIISKSSFVLPVLEEMGMKIPRDIAFIDLFLEKRDGRMAGVWQNHETVGSLSVQLLAGQLTQNVFGIPEIPTTTYVDGTWVPGDTLPKADLRSTIVVQMGEAVAVEG
jgi:LacI family transcriptional regulator